VTYDFDVFLKRQFFWLTFGTLPAGKSVTDEGTKQIQKLRVY
jgi:hypothetical protein